MTEPEAYIAELASENPEIGLKIHGLRKSYRKRVVIRDVSMSSAVRLLVCWVRTDLEKPQHFTQWLAWSLLMAEK